MRMVKFCNLHLRVPFLLLGAAEVAVCIAAVPLAGRVRFPANGLHTTDVTDAPVTTAVIFGLVIPISVMAMGLYQSHFRGTFVTVMTRTAAGFAAGAAVLASLYYLVPALHLGRGVFALALGIAFVAVISVRSLFAAIVEREHLKRRVLVLGTGERAASIERRLRRQVDRRGFQLVGHLPLSHTGTHAIDARSCLLDRGNHSLVDFCRTHAIDEIVIAAEEGDGPLPLEALLEARFQGVGVVDIVLFHEREQGWLPLELLRADSLLYSEGFEFGRGRDMIKRLFDLVASLAVLGVTWPLMLLAAVAIRIEDGRDAPVFYRQTRVGLVGEPFEILKFRSMRTDAEAAGVPTWASDADPRITRVGRVLRAMRIDELPQLLNVLCGDMSIIGPRPERPTFVEALEAQILHYGTRHAVKPGITGWAQIRYPYGASVEDAARKQEYDLYYVKNRSLLLDVLILFQTTEVVLFKREQAR